MAEQLPLDFTASVAVRQRRAQQQAAIEAQPSLFAYTPNIDIHLHSPQEAIAQITGPEPERGVLWLMRLIGPVREMKARKVAFPTSALDRLLHIRPPAQVTLDAASQAVARALWAAKVGLRPLRVSRDRQRLVASSVRWPTGFRVVDAPWSAIATILELDLPLDIDDSAKGLIYRKLADSGSHIAEAGLAGSAVMIEARRPDLLEAMKLPSLAYAGESGTGRYKMPLLIAEPLLREPTIRLSAEVESAIRKAARPAKPLPPEVSEGFPWTLYKFQAKDAGRAVKILETTGGVLLAGDMGSGKTTISLALAHHLDIWPLLVIAPLSAFSTWARQIEEMDRSFYLATEPPAKSWAAIESGQHDAIVMSYDRLPAFIEIVERYGFRGIVADEIQRIRTPGSKRSRALRALAAAVPLRIGLSGTPLTNKIDDLLPVGAFLVPGEWRPRANTKDLADMYPGDPVDSIAEHLGTMMVRRRIDQVGQEMAVRRDHRVYVQLTPEQRRALAELEAEAEKAKEDGEFDEPGSKLHAFVRLHKMRQIVADPVGAGLNCPNPKVAAALDLAEDFIAEGRKGVIFCADRNVFREIGAALDQRKIGWVGIWGSTPPDQRISNEKRFHTEEDIKVVVCTIQAGAESWSASPTGTWLISVSYVYAPSTLAQMEARVHRLSSRLEDTIDIIYMHAQAPGGTIDDRFVEIINVKKELFARVVDRQVHTDTTKVHLSMGDLMYLLTGKRDAELDAREADTKAVIAREEKKKAHARATAHRHKTGEMLDDGSFAELLEKADDLDVAEEALRALRGDEEDPDADTDDGFYRDEDDEAA